MITLQNVTKRYTKGHYGLKDISLTINDGDFVSIIGQSGAGKSTLLNLLSCEERDFEGKIIVEGIDISTLKRRELPFYRRKIGNIFQDFKLLNKTAFENIAFALDVVGKTHQEIQEIVPNVLAMVGLAGKGNNFPSEMSGGERQRVAIARALIHQPQIILADEPTGNLDNENAWDIIQLLQRINSFGATVLLATHNQEIVNALRRRVIVLEHGRIVSDRRVGRYT
ncbi:MAG: cell division ATP-binding protein FtsE [bacterium]